MLQIHFTSGDLMRTRIAAAADPLWELSLSMHVLRMRTGDPFLDAWRRQFTASMRPGGALRGPADLAFAVNPPLGYFPDFLTPLESVDGLDAGIDAVLSTPKQRLSSEISLLESAPTRHRAAIADLRAGRPGSLAALGEGMRSYHDLVLQPWWTRILTAVDADRTARGDAMITSGVAAMLGDLHPTISFADGVLRIATYPDDRHVHLDGNGLILIPSFFKRPDRPMVLADSDLPAVLVYPINRFAGYGGPRREMPLAALIGATRAAILDQVALGATATGIGQRLGISPSAVSQHLSVLRGSGLITSHQSGPGVALHLITPLGMSLLEAS
ncbi:DNA-binding transcriptional ArsR family regulator [Allocatelliglobosispora scoriae]|uniref:DNA-binding transcriptional ArsR family regulator n=1 Tax=Allocatelliglobosispora scoriae TaxID=643052 RepID=A0A841BKG2_9ACTN|nr:winged helix-turn-helix domain-containing protein [Allocatelliglobosispora scoriae]MBB5868764.1 DNA-binding transcriptional ArsR family regulator [Allocatelliglobosispora scoriae]